MPPISRIYKGSELVYSAPDTQPLTAFLTNLQPGDRIELFRSANIRTAATISAATLIGVNPHGARGTILAGPTTGVSNSTWYNINFDIGHDGWCVSDNYTQITSTVVQTTPSYFKVGDNIRLFRAANVRSSAAIAATNLKGVNPKDSLGTITAGPTKTGTINWYNINFATGEDGWVASDNYVVVAETTLPGDDWVTGSCAPAVPSGGKTINVAAGGNIKNAINSANPGDTVLVAPGIYNIGSLYLSASNSGTASGWVTIKSAQPYAAKLNGKIVPVRSDYIRIEGFEFNGPTSEEIGIGANGCHHLQILNNRVNNGKIFCGVSDFILIEGNVVHGNVLGFNQIEVLYPQNHTRDMSTKNRIIIRNNVSYDNNRPNTTDGSGIMIDCFALERPGDLQRSYLTNLLRAPAIPYTHGGICDNNICYDNNGSGIYINYSDNITVTNNICYNNNQATDSKRKNGGPWASNIAVISSKNNVIKDNVFVTLGTKTSYAISCQGFSDRTSSGNTWTGNITYNKSKPGDSSLSVMNTCPVPAASNQLGKGSQYTTRPTDFLKEPCSG